MQSELKPCPFCGGAPEGKYGSRADVNCTSCPAAVSVSLHPGIFTTYEGQRRAEEAKAVEAWNRRAALSDQERAVEVKALETARVQEAIDGLVETDTLLVHRGEKLVGTPLSGVRDAVRSALAVLRSALVDAPVEPVKPDWWQDEEAAEREFTDYFVRNYPGPDTIIYDPKWHAPKLFRAAKHALLATKASPPP